MKLFKKDTPIQVFSGEFCKIYKITFFTEHLCATASGLCIRLSSTSFYQLCKFFIVMLIIYSGKIIFTEFRL